MPTIIIKVDLECGQCHAKIEKVLDRIRKKGKFVIDHIEYKEKNNRVIVSGPFDADKLTDMLCCKTGSIIQEIEIVPQPKKEKPQPPPLVVVKPPPRPPPAPTYPYPWPSGCCCHHGHGGCHCCSCGRQDPPPQPYPYPYPYPCVGFKIVHEEDPCTIM